MTKPSVLFVSIAFPPKRDPECIQAGRYLKYLYRLNPNITVLTSASPTLFMPIDEGLKAVIPDGLAVIKLMIPEFKWLNFLLRKLKITFVDRPDSKFLFHFQAKRALRLIDKKPELIYSRSYPLSSTIMAKKLQEHWGIPWVLHLSDPWLLSPLHHYTGTKQAYHQKEEYACLSKASAVCFTSEATIALYAKHYPEFTNKFVYSPNVYDSDDITFENEPYNPLRVVYTGGLTGARTAEPILKALQELLLSNPKKAKLLDVIFAGDMDSKNRKIFEQYQLPMVKHIGPLSFQAAKSLQKSAGHLIIIDNANLKAEQAVFFPSKILDYIVCKRPYFAITSAGSVTDLLLKQLHRPVFYHNDTKEIENYFRLIADGQIDVSRKDEATEIFEAAYQAAHLDTLICKIVRDED